MRLGERSLAGTETSTQGTYYGTANTTTNLAITAAPGSNSRIDIVVAQVEDTFYSGATDAFSLAVVDGVVDASPVAPATPDNAIKLAEITVTNGDSSVVNANISDTRQKWSLYSSSSWTPSWTNLTVGNGTLTGNYQRTGDLVSFQIKLVFGSTTSISGDVEVSLPVTAADAYEAAAGVGGTLYFVSGGTNTYYVWGNVDTTSNIKLATGATTVRKEQVVTASFPVVWTTTDIWAITGTYRAA